MRPRHLVLFVRAPRSGVGKRRLARDIGDVAALRFERADAGAAAAPARRATGAGGCASR